MAPAVLAALYLWARAVVLADLCFLKWDAILLAALNCSKRVARALSDVSS